MTELERRPDGTFPKGVSGNPGGKPRRLPATAKEVAELASSYTSDVVEKLAAVVEAMSPARPTMAGIKAAQLLLERGHGLPVTELDRMEYEAAVGGAKTYTDDQRRSFAEATGLELSMVTDAMLRSAGVPLGGDIVTFSFQMGEGDADVIDGDAVEESELTERDAVA